MLQLCQQVPEARSLLIRVGHLEDAALVEEVADDLEADREAIAGAAWDAFCMVG